MRKTSLPWFKFYQDAWLDGTRDLPPDQRGIYIDCLCLMYRLDGPIAKDDKWMSHYLHVPIKKWRAIRTALVACGKLVDTRAGLINSRAGSEIVERSKLRENKSVAAANREQNERENPKFSFENNKRRPQLWLVNEDQKAQEGLHARASSDHQREKEESKKEQAEVLPTRQMDDDDPYNRRRELDPKIVATMQQRIGQKRAEHILKAYFRSHYAKGAGLIDKAFPGWLAKSYGEKISEELTPKELAAEILDLCGGGLTLPTAKQLASRRKKA